jgi:hypothetical protein
MTCSAPWHAGMAHTLGFLRAGLMAIQRGFKPEPLPRDANSLPVANSRLTSR